MCNRNALLRLVVVVVIAMAGPAFAESVIGTANGKVYHNHPELCGSAKRIGADNITRFASRQEAEQAGRRQCKRCAGLDKKAAEQTPVPGEGSGDASAGAGGGQRSTGPVPPIRLAADRQSPTPPVLRLPQIAHATKVLDGGTIELDTGDKASLLSVIVPHRGQPAARDAHRFIKEQTRDRLLTLSMPESSPGLMARDALGRWRVSAAPQGGRDLAGELLFHGYAWLDRDHLTERTAEYARLEEAAWRAGRGIWRQLPGECGARVVVTGRGATQYHDAKCEHAPHLTQPMSMSVNEARARRLVPCSEYRAKGDEKSGQV